MPVNPVRRVRSRPLTTDPLTDLLQRAAEVAEAPAARRWLRELLERGDQESATVRPDRKPKT
jgi:hypothetical protein